MLRHIVALANLNANMLKVKVLGFFPFHFARLMNLLIKMSLLSGFCFSSIFVTSPSAEAPSFAPPVAGSTPLLGSLSRAAAAALLPLGRSQALPHRASAAGAEPVLA